MARPSIQSGRIFVVHHQVSLPFFILFRDLSGGGSQMGAVPNGITDFLSLSFKKRTIAIEYLKKKIIIFCS
jgi:hypothetical protein